MLKNEFENTGELGCEDIYNYYEWSNTKEYTEMANAYNFQENIKMLKEAI